MMQGSLDLPPIVIRSSKSTSLLLLLIAVVFVAIGVGMLRDPTQTPAIGYLEIVFFGAAIPIFGWRLVRPDVLAVAPDGITWRRVLRTVHWAWDDIQNFRPYSPGSRTLSKHLGFDFTHSYRAQKRGFDHAVIALTSVEGSFGGGWEPSAAELADLFNQARARWATDQR
jgi:hypothetical protein